MKKILFFICSILLYSCEHSEDEQPNVIIPEVHYDIVIVGAGISGISAAYALKDAGLKVALIEKQTTIGGTQINAWVNCNAASGDVPYIREITKELISLGKAKYVTGGYQNFTPEVLKGIDYQCTLVEQRFLKNGKVEACVSYNIDDLRNRYLNDLAESIDIYTSYSFVSAKLVGESQLSEILVDDLNTMEQKRFIAKLFIDSSGDDILVRNVCPLRDEDFFVGSDSKNRYFVSHGFVEAHASHIDDPDCLNYPTLMYNIVPGSEDLENVQSGYYNDALVYSTPNNTLYVNSVSYLAYPEYDLGQNATGDAVIHYGADVVRNSLITRTHQHWKTIKMGNSPRFAVLGLHKMKYNEYAPMLGVRETYRASCERMLNENDLYIQISQQNIGQGTNLDKKIAIGNHSVDIHGNTAIDVKFINENLKPYGVAYGCLVPKKLANVLVASRGAGFTHIGAATFRLNKDMAQIGWVAGKAALMFCEGSLENVRDVDVSILQSDAYSGFAGLVREVESMIQ